MNNKLFLITVIISLILGGIILLISGNVGYGIGGALLSFVVLYVLGFLLLIFVGAIVIGLGFRNKYPLDFLINLQPITDFLSTKGFKRLCYREEGTSHPYVILSNGKIPLKVMLNAPVFKDSTIDVIFLDDSNRQWNFPTSDDNNYSSILKEIEENLQCYM